MVKPASVVRADTPATSELLLSVSIPTHNNLHVLQQCIGSWREMAGELPIELIVIEDGCTDGTNAYLTGLAQTPWGRRALRHLTEADAHELRCTNRGLSAARAPLVLVWQDDMFLRTRWFVPELLRTFRDYPEIGLLGLSRGLLFTPLDESIERWEDLYDDRRLRSTIGLRPLNWCRLQEVDALIRPWVVRKTCLERVGLLDEAFVPTEYDETDLAFRIRAAGWSVAIHGFERVGAYVHLGSTTIGRAPPAPYRARVLRNGVLFHERWSAVIAAEHARARRQWWRRATVQGWLSTIRQSARLAARAARRRTG